MKNLTFIAFSVLLLAACQTSSDEMVTPGATSSIAQRSNQPRAFQANLTGTVDFNSVPTPCHEFVPVAAFDYNVSGNATHLGNLNASLSIINHDECDLDLDAATLTTVVSGALVAANGDLITYTGLDVINVFNLLTESGPNGPITGTWTITGGTGRFEDASGSFTISGLVDFTTLNFTAVADGTITF